MVASFLRAPTTFFTVDCCVFFPFLLCFRNVCVSLVFPLFFVASYLQKPASPSENADFVISKSAMILVEHMRQQTAKEGHTSLEIFCRFPFVSAIPFSKDFFLFLHESPSVSFHLPLIFFKISTQKTFMAPLVSIGPSHLKIKRKPPTVTPAQRLAELTRQEEADRLQHAARWNHSGTNEGSGGSHSLSASPEGLQASTTAALQGSPDGLSRPATATTTTHHQRAPFAYARDPKEIRRQQNKYLEYFRSTIHDAETVQSILMRSERVRGDGNRSSSRGGGAAPPPLPSQRAMTTPPSSAASYAAHQGQHYHHTAPAAWGVGPQQQQQQLGYFPSSHSLDLTNGGGSGGVPSSSSLIHHQRWPHLPQLQQSQNNASLLSGLDSTTLRSSASGRGGGPPAAMSQQRVPSSSRGQQGGRGGAAMAAPAVDLRSLHPKSAVVYVKYEKLLRRMKYEDDEFMAFRRRYLAQQ